MQDRAILPPPSLLVGTLTCHSPLSQPVNRLRPGEGVRPFISVWKGLEAGARALGKPPSPVWSVTGWVNCDRLSAKSALGSAAPRGMGGRSREVAAVLLLCLLMGFNPGVCSLPASPCLTGGGRACVCPHRDYTDNDLDGGEVENASRSRSSPPIPSATGCLESHFGQDQTATESTGNLLLFCMSRV